MWISCRSVTRLYELSPVFKPIESSDHILRIGQCEVVWTLLSVGKIEKLIADKVANLFDVERAMEEIVEARGCLEISRVIDGYKIFCDTTVLFDLWTLCSLNVMNEPGPTFETVLARQDKLSIGQYRCVRPCMFHHSN